MPALDSFIILTIICSMCHHHTASGSNKLKYISISTSLDKKNTVPRLKLSSFGVFQFYSTSLYTPNVRLIKVHMNKWYFMQNYIQLLTWQQFNGYRNLNTVIATLIPWIIIRKKSNLNEFERDMIVDDRWAVIRI